MTSTGRYLLADVASVDVTDARCFRHTEFAEHVMVEQYRKLIRFDPVVEREH